MSGRWLEPSILTSLTNFQLPCGCIWFEMKCSLTHETAAGPQRQSSRQSIVPRLGLPHRPSRGQSLDTDLSLIHTDWSVVANACRYSFGAILCACASFLAVFEDSAGHQFLTQLGRFRLMGSKHRAVPTFGETAKVTEASSKIVSTYQYPPTFCKYSFLPAFRHDLA